MAFAHEFAQEAIDEAHRVAKQPLGEREDLTHLPIVAIDPADARDHDDAIWAEPDDDPDNAGGWKAIVAIADVSFYVRPDRELDREARARGNSVYFPDRVVPMLPEELSADICSLKAGRGPRGDGLPPQDREGRHAQKLAFHTREDLRRCKHCLRGCAGCDRRVARKSGSRFHRRPARCLRSKARFRGSSSNRR